jgi:hypothetical protein
MIAHLYVSVKDVMLNSYVNFVKKIDYTYFKGSYTLPVGE